MAHIAALLITADISLVALEGVVRYAKRITPHNTTPHKKQTALIFFPGSSHPCRLTATNMHLQCNISAFLEGEL